MNFKKGYFLLLFIAFTFVTKADHYNFKKYDAKNGLANSSVLQIIQDHQGYLWFATSGGLSCFDGRKYKNYYTSDGLPTNDITSLFEDENNNLWVGTSHGLSKFHDGKFLNYTEKGLDKLIYSIYQDNSKRLWFVTKSAGLVCYDGKLFRQITKKNGLPTDSLFSILQDSQGDYWIGTYHYGVCRIPKESIDNNLFQAQNFTKKEGLNSNNIFCLIQASANTIWLGTTNGAVNVISNGKVEHLFISEETKTDQILSLLKDKRGNIWIGTGEHGLIKYDSRNFTFYNEKNGLSSHLINSVFEDNEGNIWIGTDQGTFLFKNEAFIAWKETDGLPSKLVQCFIKTSNNHMLCGTALGLIDLNGDDIKVIKDIPELTSASIYSLATDQKNNIWIGTQDGLYICSYKDHLKVIKKITEYKGNYSYPVSSLLFSKSNKMYVATFGNGLFVFDGDDILHYGVKEGLTAESIYSLFEDASNNLWISTLQNGAIKFDGNKFTNFTKKNGLPDNTINGIAQDRRGNLLFATSEGGLSCYDGRLFHNYNETTGLLSNLIFTVKVDDKNAIWLGTNKGLNKAVLKDYFDLDYSKFYTDANGLEGNEFGNNSLYIDPEGIIWTGTTEGLTRFNTSLDFPNQTPPNLVLQEIRLAYQKVNWRNFADSVNPRTGLPLDLKLTYKDNHLTFYFQALTTDNNVKYRYMLEGLESRWSPSTSSSEAIYANIPSGRDYVFRVQAVNSDGIWSTKNIEYHFTIQSPIYQRWWFVILSAAALITCLFLFINYRTKRLAEEKKKLEEKVEERTTELKETNSKLNVAFTDIKDSINYAKRIQQAILPVQQKIRDVLPDSFILFKPRDVVSGDFYWFGTVENKKEVHHIIAAADCTGHGVPGAFMSMIGNTILNEIVITKEITDPGEILSQLHNGVRSALKQNQNTSRDGMDICLCSINPKTREVIYAGAFNPLWILRNNKTVEVIKATKTAIGGFTSENQKFQSHSVQLQEGEAIYLFTDGFADQFGGNEGKKLTTKKFRDTLVSLYDKSMDEQGFYLNNYIEIWRGKEFQVDDILVIGVKV